MQNLKDEIMSKMEEILGILQKYEVDKDGMLNMCVDNTEGEGYISFFMVDEKNDVYIVDDHKFMYKEEDDENGSSE